MTLSADPNTGLDRGGEKKWMILTAKLRRLKLSRNLVLVGALAHRAAHGSPGIDTLGIARGTEQERGGVASGRGI